MNDVNCPYCGHEIIVCNDDGFGTDENETYQMECPNCEKNFVLNCFIHISYDAYVADCLNDGEHDWKLTHTSPRELSRMRCTMCAEERRLTPDEKIEHNIGEYKFN
jgi:DNA-directed RNA polymerase subunit RPC12/RpoP